MYTRTLYCWIGIACSEPNSVTRAFIEAGVEAGHRYNPDPNGARQEGVGWMDCTVSGGVRQSASRGFL